MWRTKNATDMENFTIMMEVVIKENGSKIKWTAMENSTIVLAYSLIKAIGIKISFMDQEKFTMTHLPCSMTPSITLILTIFNNNGLTMKVNSNMTSNKVTVSSCLKTANISKAIFMLIVSTDKESSLTLKGKLSMESGKIMFSFNSLKYDHSSN